MTATVNALELQGITKRFGQVVALDDANFALRRGTVHALLGENGAGKTTLMHIAYGMLRPDAGHVLAHGVPLAPGSTIGSISAGIGMVHQHFTLVPAMTVAENLALGGSGVLRRAEMRSRVKQISARLGFALDPDARVETLPVGAQQRVEIAKALARNASVLILDEPTAVLAPTEVDDLLRWLRSYVAEGNSAVLITHKLREALALANEVTVLRRGRVVHTATAAESTAESLTVAMIGAAGSVAGEQGRDATIQALGHPAWVAEAMTVRDDDGRVRVRGASFVIRGGELVGVAAVEGNGQRELLRALAGRRPASGLLQSPRDVGFVPEDRHHDAVLLERSLTENVALRGLGGRRGTIGWTRERAATKALMEKHDVRAESPHVAMRSLSGGNQQKLVLARELARDASDSPDHGALVVENPPRGLDVRATAAVHERLRDACAQGAAVVMYSSDLDEILSLATRVLVMFEGSVREMPVDREAVGRAMLGLE